MAAFTHPGSQRVESPTPATTEAPLAGLLVCDVALDGPARRAEIQRYDRILAINGQPLDSFDALAGALQAHYPGQTITLATRRGSADLSADVQLGERDGRAYLGLTGCV